MKKKSSVECCFLKKLKLMPCAVILASALMIGATGCSSVEPISRSYHQPSTVEETSDKTREYKPGFEELWQEFVAALEGGNPDRTQETAEKFYRLAESFLKQPDLPADVRFWLSERHLVTRRAVLQIVLCKEMNRLDRIYQAEESYSGSLRACQEAIRFLESFMQDPQGYRVGEERLNTFKKEWGARQQQEQMDFDATVSLLQKKLRLEQRKYCTTRGLKDVGFAQDELNKQQRKRFNWGYLGYWRDDSEVLSLAAVLANRVAQESLVDYEIRQKGYSIHQKIIQRLSNERKASLQSYPLPRYCELADFPARSEDELKCAADGSRPRHDQQTVTDGQRSESVTEPHF